jgi:uncharacterized membrane protein HdeD (DUF308 family)
MRAQVEGAATLAIAGLISIILGIILCRSIPAADDLRGVVTVLIPLGLVVVLIALGALIDAGAKLFRR